MGEDGIAINWFACCPHGSALTQLTKAPPSPVLPANSSHRNGSRSIGMIHFFGEKDTPAGLNQQRISAEQPGFHRCTALAWPGLRRLMRSSLMVAQLYQLRSAVGVWLCYGQYHWPSLNGVCPTSGETMQVPYTPLFFLFFFFIIFFPLKCWKGFQQQIKSFLRNQNATFVPELVRSWNP